MYRNVLYVTAETRTESPNTAAADASLLEVKNDFPVFILNVQLVVRILLKYSTL
jgi:hypothetical protein